MTVKEYSFKEVPTIRRFCDDRSFLTALMGPFGSGKSVGCVIKLLTRAREQKAGPDGISRSRWAVVRNSYPQIRDTVVPTVHEWVLELGDWHKTDNDLVINKIKNNDGAPMEAIFHFRALDKPDDIKNLLSLEISGCWFNEVREIPKRIVDAMRGRVGRYPKKDLKTGFQGPSWFGLIMDSNPPDTDHWFYRLFEEEKPHYCVKCRDKQGGVILLVKNLDGSHSCPQCKGIEGIPFAVLYKQPSGRGPNAENLIHLPTGYYSNLAAGMDKNFINVYVDGEYGYVSDGKPVYTMFDPDKHVAKETLKADPRYPLIIGFDNTGRDQAAIICQYLPSGQLRVLHEFIMTDIGTRTLVRDIVKPFIISTYSGASLILTGDPAGVRKSDTDERTTFQEINEAFNMTATPARSNTLSARLGAVDSLLKKFLGQDQYGISVSPACPMIIKGFRGEYRMRRLQVVGKDMYTDKPEKNLASHGHDALQYACMAVEDALTLLSGADSPFEKDSAFIQGTGSWNAFI